MTSYGWYPFILGIIFIILLLIFLRIFGVI